MQADFDAASRLHWRRVLILLHNSALKGAARAYRRAPVPAIAASSACLLPVRRAPELRCMSGLPAISRRRATYCPKAASDMPRRPGLVGDAMFVRSFFGHPALKKATIGVLINAD